MDKDRLKPTPLSVSFVGRFTWQSGEIEKAFAKNVINPQDWQVGYLTTDTDGLYFLMGNGDVWHTTQDKNEELKRRPLSMVAQKVGIDGKQGTRYLGNVPHAYIEYSQIEDSSKEASNPKIKDLDQNSKLKFEHSVLIKIDELVNSELSYYKNLKDYSDNTLRITRDVRWDFVSEELPELKEDIKQFKAILILGLLTQRQFPNQLSETIKFQYSEVANQKNQDILVAMTLGQIGLYDDITNYENIEKAINKTKAKLNSANINWGKFNRLELLAALI